MTSPSAPPFPWLARYQRHRDALLTATYTVLCIWHSAGAAGYQCGSSTGSGGSGASWRGVVAGAEGAWVVLLGGVLQARFAWHAVAMLAAVVLAAAARGPPCQALLGWGGGLDPGRQAAACGLTQALLQSCAVHLALASERPPPGWLGGPAGSKGGASAPQAGGAGLLVGGHAGEVMMC